MEKEQAINYALSKITTECEEHLRTLQRLANYKLGFFNSSEWVVSIEEIQDRI